MWTSSPRSEAILPVTDGRAYWGIGYKTYLSGDASKKVFRCPSARVVDEWRETGLSFPSSWWWESSYGMNTFVVDSPLPGGKSPRKASDFAIPSTMILAQDAAEQKMEGASDSLGLFPGQTENLTQWVYGLAGLYPEIKDMRELWFRHNRQCNTLWADGRVSPIRYSKGEDVDFRWYTGEPPLLRPAN
jgi:prepilin-type processing-associated H-X9-DG protein